MPGAGSSNDGGMDGIIAKRRDLAYLAGTRDAMQKIKSIRSADCIVGPFSLHRSGSLPLSQRFSDARPLPRRFYQPHHRPPFVVGQVDLALDVIPQQRKNA